MDRPLEDAIAERQSLYQERAHNRDYTTRTSLLDQSRKWHNANDAQDIETEWVHDKFEDDPHTREVRATLRGKQIDSYTPSYQKSSTTKIRVDNLHYDLTEDDLTDLFTRIAPVIALSLRFDRAGRSTGTAFVTYSDMSSANRAIREFDGANAAGQPIRLTLIAVASSGGSSRRSGALTPTRNAFETATKPGRSLFERIENPGDGSRLRSRSPDRTRRSNMERIPPPGVDRYIPASFRSRRTRSNSPRGRISASIRESSMDMGNRVRGEHNHRSYRDAKAWDGKRTAQARPKKTQEDLDREMDEYWENKHDINGQRLELKAVTSIDEGMDVEMNI